MVFVALMSKHGEKGKIALPLSVPAHAEMIAAEYGRKVVRTKLNSRSLMEAAGRRDFAFGGTQQGAYIFRKFMPAYDAAMTLCRLLELLAKEGRSLSEVRADLPEAYLAQRNTYCSWEQKGLVMRKLIERAKEADVEMLDGVKVTENDGWVLVVPDQDKPVFQVYAEAEKTSLAEKKVDDIIDFISSLVV